MSFVTYEEAAELAFFGAEVYSIHMYVCTIELELDKRFCAILSVSGVASYFNDACDKVEDSRAGEELVQPRCHRNGHQ